MPHHGGDDWSRAVQNKEDWDFYFATLDEKPAAFALDLNALQSTDPAQCHLICVRINLRAARPDGLCAHEEADVLSAIEDTLAPAMAVHCKARQVSRLTTDGHREFIFYGATPDGLTTALHEAFDDHPDYRPSYRTNPDPEWRFFYEFLAPSPQNFQWIMDRRVVDQLAQHGDDHKIPRPIDHYVIFPNAGARAGFRSAVAHQGFKTSTKDTEKGDFALNLQRADATRLDHIHQVAWDLRQLAQMHGGTYDGWGAPIVEPPEPG
jgi:hypothetical protein